MRTAPHRLTRRRLAVPPYAAHHIDDVRLYMLCWGYAWYVNTVCRAMAYSASDGRVALLLHELCYELLWSGPFVHAGYGFLLAKPSRLLRGDVLC